jgi:mannose-1-phosphate guanylyltransferase / mannose-6-phosphate isomerase
VTSGITAERAATEYGYIKSGRGRFRRGSHSRRIRGEAGAAKAAEYIKAGYLWNSGNFMFRASVLLDEYRKFDASRLSAIR